MTQTIEERARAIRDAMASDAIHESLGVDILRESTAALLWAQIGTNDRIRDRFTTDILDTAQRGVNDSQINPYGFATMTQRDPWVFIDDDSQIVVKVDESVVKGDKIVVEEAENVVLDQTYHKFVEEKMKINPTIDPLFNDFLRSNKILKMFISEWVNIEESGIKLILDSRAHYISGSFFWHTTKRGYEFWSNWSIKWVKYLMLIDKDNLELPEEVLATKNKL